MPVVTISVKQLNSLLKKQPQDAPSKDRQEDYTMDTLVDALEQLGCDVEDTVEIVMYHCPACDTLNEKLDKEEAATRCSFCGHDQEEAFDKFATDSSIRLDLLADRPDLFNVGGLARALRGYLGLEEGMTYFQCEESDIEVEVDPSVLEIRPYIVCAAAELPPLDHYSLRELMKLQENIHWGIGRDRKLASIGIYDLDSITTSITYKSVEPTEFKFHPLAFPDVEMSPKEILEKHPKGTAYAKLLEKLPRYPLLIDSKGQTLSMPPIINSEETKCRIGTTRLFIDVTGIGEQAVTDALNILVCELVEMGGTLKSVKINYPDHSITQPQLTPGSIDVGYERSKAWLGIDMNRDEFLQSIRKMRLDVTPIDNPQKGSDYNVKYAVYRSDIRHEVDIFEDILIGYGLNRVPMRLVPTMTVGSERPEERISNMVRGIMTGFGFTEIMSLNLNSEENSFTKLGIEPGESYVRVDNPKTLNQRVLRNHLMTGMLETFEKNKKKAVPQRIFELGSVTDVNLESETGVDEYRNLGFAIIGPDAGYAEARALLDSVLRELGLSGQYRAVEHPSFLSGRCAEVSGADGLWARVGEMHPRAITNFGLAFPIAYCELRLAKVF